MPFDAPPQAHAAATTVEREIVREINRVRRLHGLAAVRIDGRLVRLARRHSLDMLRCDKLSHTSSDGASLRARISRAGTIRAYGEVLAWTPNGTGSSARAIVRLWLRSAPHRHILLNGRLHRIGIGLVTGAMGSVRGRAVTGDFSS